MKSEEKIKIMLEAPGSTSIVAYRTFLKEVAAKLDHYRWHDLDDDPKYLPSTSRSVLVAYIVEGDKKKRKLYATAAYDKVAHWRTQGNTNEIFEELGCKVIAWRDIEPFEEE